MTPVVLPSPGAGATTQTVGWFEADAGAVADWLARTIERSTVSSPGWSSLDEAAGALRAAPERRFLRAAIPVGPAAGDAAGPAVVGGWTALLTSGPLGTDVGMLPSHAAEELGCRALRATCVPDDADDHPIRLLELFGPDGQPPLLTVRSVTAADDGGGRWVFETFGDPLPFEDLDAYRARRKRDRFTPEMLERYLRELGVPVDAEPDWADARLVTTDES